MEESIFELAKQCPDLTISVKASALIEMGRTIKEELLQEFRLIRPELEKQGEDLITREQAMKKLKVSSATLWRWKKCGYLVPIRIGVFDRYRLSDINALIEKKGGAL